MSGTVKAMVFFDGTGKIWAVCGGVETLPDGLDALIADMPLNGRPVRVDVENRAAIFETDEE